MVKYDRMWERMKKMGLVKSDLMKVVSAPTISALRKNEYVKLTTIENLCIFLECGPEDILEFDGDRTHVSWRTDKGYKNRFTGKTILTASELLTGESLDK